MTLLSKLGLATNVGNVLKAQVRYSGHGRPMLIKRADYMWSKFKDYLHLYLMLGIIPLTVITTYVNVTVGQAELCEIPEGYTPHYYEYFKSPISRFIAKNLLYDKARDYETMASKFNEESESLLLKKLDRELQAHMKENKDNKSYYFVPVDLDQKMHRLNVNKNKFIILRGLHDAGDP